MKIIIFAFIVFANSFTFYINSDNYYSVLLPEERKVENIFDPNSGEELEQITVFDSGGTFKYIIMTTVFPEKTKNLLLDESIQIFEEECVCSVTKSEDVEYSNFKGVKYSILKENLKGYAIMSSKGEVNFNLIYLTLENKISLYDDEFDDIMNSLVLNLPDIISVHRE